ncbi:MAG TPA: dihydrolipoamide acetyltransferase family protein [Sedimentisphaerales bacterium]|nr:dihydrolipoamide acetyltransferase family protein [Sedimentisphaerales bacterium]
MATEVKIPTPDQTTEEVRIVKWCKAPGDVINKGEVILEIETDKAVLEVECAASGVLLKQLFAEDQIVPVGTVVGLIGDEGEKLRLPAQQQASAPAPQKVQTAPPAVTPDASVKASPLALKTAEKLGVELAQVTGTGHRGKIMAADVEKFSAPASAADIVEARALASPNAKRLARDLGVDLSKVKGSGPKGRITGKDVERYAESAPAAASAPPQPGTVVPLTRMRRAIGINLQGSSRDRPHFNVTMSVDMSRAIQMRARFNKSRPEDARLSVNHLVIAACAKALRQHPAVNSRFEGDQISYLPDVNIGIATAVEEGLVVPVLVNADRLDWDALISESRRLVEEARKGKIIGAGKGTFTISNLGMFGVDYFTAIINPPESAILAVGAVKNEAVDIGGAVGLRPIMKLTLCSDHRVVDGVVAAEFLRSMRIYLEEQIVCP